MISTPPPLSIDDLERLINHLALTQKTDENDDENTPSVNASRVMYRFWLKTDDEQENALMQYLDIMKRNKKFQTFVKMALRAALLETARHGDYFDKADDLYMEIAEMMNKMDWSRE